MFIVIEGMDGAGKTKLIDNLRVALPGVLSSPLAFTREPGGTNVAEALRDILKHGKDQYSETLTEETRLLLFNAARHQHMVNKVYPLLQEDHVVVCDRFNWTTLAYTTPECVDFAIGLHTSLFKGFEPDLTIYLDIDKETSLSRRSSTGLDDIEKQLYPRFDEARAIYKELVVTSKKAVLIDGSLPESRVLSLAIKSIMEIMRGDTERTIEDATQVC